MTENPGRIRALLDQTLTDEPPLLDLVPGAVTGAGHSRRRTRALAGGAAVAVLAVGAGAYGLAGRATDRTARPSGQAVTPPSPAHSGPTPTSTLVTKSHKSDFGIPGLFDHPAAPPQECMKINAPVTASKTQLSSAVERDYCVRVLTQIRALLPDATVVLEPLVDFDQPTWSAPLMKTPDGGTAPGFVQAYQAAAKNPAKVDYATIYLAFHTAHGDGLVTYQTTLPGTKAKQEPGGDIPLGDGTAGHFSQDDAGSVHVSGTTADGQWYDLVVSGVYAVYGASGSTLQPTLKGDGKSHEVYPDGYVLTSGPNDHVTVPNPFSATQVRAMIDARGLGNLVKGIGADPFSVVVPPQ